MFRRYENLIVWGPFAAIDAHGLDRVEREIGRALPNGYRQFLFATNGGRLKYSVSLPPGGEGELISFDELTPASRLSQAWQDHQVEAEMAGFPPDLLPVANDGCGSRLYLDLRPATHGQVLAFVHGLPEWAGGDGGDSFGPVATNWNEYLELLTFDEDFAEVTWEDVCEDDASPANRAWKEAVIAWLDAGLPGWRQREWAR